LQVDGSFEDDLEIARRVAVHHQIRRVRDLVLQLRADGDL